MIVGGFWAPIICLMIGLPSMSLALSVTTSISETMPLTSWNVAIAVPLTSILKRCATRASCGSDGTPLACVGVLLSVGRRSPVDRAGHSVSDVPPENWARRKITNSAGFTGAIPMSTISWPASIDSAVLFSPSHFT